MSDSFVPRTPVSLQIRRIIFENHNACDEGGGGGGDCKFNSDDIFEALKRGGDVDPGWIIDDLEPAINELCRSGAARNIAQNFTTIWLKLSERLEPAGSCAACHGEVFLGASEEKRCPGCGSAL